MEKSSAVTMEFSSALRVTQVVNYYSKRMQIEQSFRDIKSHQFGLSARYASTKSIYRWGVKMLLAAIVQTMFWIIYPSPLKVLENLFEID